MNTVKQTFGFVIFGVTCILYISTLKYKLRLWAGLADAHLVALRISRTVFGCIIKIISFALAGYCTTLQN